MRIAYIKEITKDEAYYLVEQFHYSKVMPRLTKVCIGGFSADDELIAAVTFGWGTRPRHTIQKLFPSLDTQDYYEIGKMCLHDDLPRNSESYFLSQCMKHLKKNYPAIKVVFTWADGILGKAGYVYQASNFSYAGDSMTDTYYTNEGEKVHPRTAQKMSTNSEFKTGSRPKFHQLQELGWKHIQGKQFRYVIILDKRMKKKLIKECTFNLRNNDYPKDKDLVWRVKVADRCWIECEQPFHNRDATSIYKSKKEDYKKGM